MGFHGPEEGQFHIFPQFLETEAPLFPDCSALLILICAPTRNGGDKEWVHGHTSTYKIGALDITWQKDRRRLAVGRLKRF